MKRDIANIKRDLDNRYNNDIIYKKDQIMKIFQEDPDLKEVLGAKQPKPLNKYRDANNPTEEELKKLKSKSMQECEITVPEKLLKNWEKNYSKISCI